MTEILIRHCKVRLIRRGGWSWGPAPRKLAEEAVRMVSKMVEEQLESLWSDEDDVEIVETIRIKIPLRLGIHGFHSAELLDPFQEPNGSIISEQFNEALESALARYPSKALAPQIDDHEEHLVSSTHRMSREVFPEAAVFRLLLIWREQGLLEQHLISFSPEVLEAFHWRLLSEPGKAATFSVTPVPDLDAFLADFLSRTFNLPNDRSGRLRLRLLVIVEASASLSIVPSDPRLLIALDKLIPLSESALISHSDLQPEESTHLSDFSVNPEASPVESQFESGAHSFSKTGSVSFVRRLSSPLPVSLEFECRIEQALPFLLLPPLSRIGYLDALTASLEASELLHQADRFATAMAYKVLPPPERGWRRSLSETRSAAVFAGLDEALLGSEVNNFADCFAPFLSPLDSTLKESLIAGHDSNQPLFIKRTQEGGFLVVDVEGIFPIAWAKTPVDLTSTLARFGATTILIPAASADNALFLHIHEAGLRFITDVPPTRNENWRSLRPPSSLRYWTNDWSLSEGRLFLLAQPLVDVAQEADDLWQAFAVDRPVTSQTVDGAFDRSLNLAVSAALGTIGWILWREREPVTPLLALQRFRDFDAHVRFDHESVQVKFPLGKRFWDLRSHGLLGDLTDVPWLAGRVLQFTGG